MDILLKDTTMEITTTMVRFVCPKAMMQIKTPKAQMFAFGPEVEKRVWVPVNKVIVKSDKNSDNLNVCTMPKWLYSKTMLPLYTQIEEEFTHTESVENI